jgi:hypothetical protein
MFKIIVYRIINRYVLSARVCGSNAMLRFRFKHPLNLLKVQSGLEIEVLDCEFSNTTKLINCNAIHDNSIIQCKKRTFMDLIHDL